MVFVSIFVDCAHRNWKLTKRNPVSRLLDMHYSIRLANVEPLSS